jgi:hypothetical protein
MFPRVCQVKVRIKVALLYYTAYHEDCKFYGREWT